MLLFSHLSTQCCGSLFVGHTVLVFPSQLFIPYAVLSTQRSGPWRSFFFNIEGPCSSQGSNLQGAIQQDDITSMLLVETSLPGLQEGIPAPGGPNKTPICAYTQVWYSSYFDLAGTATKERA